MKLRSLPRTNACRIPLSAPPARRKKLAFPAVWVCVLALALSVPAARAGHDNPTSPVKVGLAGRPNIVMIVTDDQGYGDLSAHGHPVLRTPNLDRLHRESVRFTDFHVAPMCVFSRAQLMTGVHNLSSLVDTPGEETHLRPNLTTLPEALRGAGYRTAHFGKWRLGTKAPNRPHDRGFQEAVWFHGAWLPAEQYFDTPLYHGDQLRAHKGFCTDVLFDEALAWIGARAKDAKGQEPFFAYLATNAGHTPLVAPESDTAPFLSRGFSKDDASYLGMIKNLDDNVGRLEALLDSAGLRSNTLFVFLSDNGGQSARDVYNAGMRGKKRFYYEGGHRVPLFIRWPAGKLRSGRDVTDLTQVQDLLPTLIDLVGISVPSRAQFEGVSLARVLRDEAQRLADRTLVVQYPRPNGGKGDAAVLWGRWRLLHDKELYDLDGDPGQTTDIAARHPEIVAKMRTHYERWWSRIEPGLQISWPDRQKEAKINRPPDTVVIGKGGADGVVAAGKDGVVYGGKYRSGAAPDSLSPEESITELQPVSTVRMAVDSAGQPHVVFTTRVTQQAKRSYYTARIGGRWLPAEKFADAADFPERTRAYVADVATDGQGHVLVSFWVSRPIEKRWEHDDPSFYYRWRSPEGQWGPPLSLSAHWSSAPKVEYEPGRGFFLLWQSRANRWRIAGPIAAGEKFTEAQSVSTGSEALVGATASQNEGADFSRGAGGSFVVAGNVREKPEGPVGVWAALGQGDTVSSTTFLGSFPGTKRGDESSVHPVPVIDAATGAAFIAVMNPGDKRAYYTVHRDGSGWQLPYAPILPGHTAAPQGNTRQGPSVADVPGPGVVALARDGAEQWRLCLLAPPAAVNAIRSTRVSIVNGQWRLNGKVTYPGAKAEGLLMNVRMVNATFEDANDQTRPQGFDPEANTDAFIKQIPDYVAGGVRAFTINLQGGIPGYRGAVNSAFNPDGSLRDAYLKRVRRVIEACDRHGAVVILGCYYQQQDQILRHEQAVRAGVVNVAKWIKERGFGNVVLEVANEFAHAGFDHRILKSAAGEAELIALAKQTAPQLLVSTSGMGSGTLPDEVANASDFLLIHFNTTKLEDVPARIAALKKYGKPIVCNEDDKVGEEGAKAAELCVTGGASWGLMLVEHNQHFPFNFHGAADDPVVYAVLKQLTTPAAKTAWNTLGETQEHLFAPFPLPLAACATELAQQYR
ncbi:MAG: sulfatase-like hydrolase/transferase [Blastocatellia bacterium]